MIPRQTNPKKFLISRKFSCILAFSWLFGFIPIKSTYLFTTNEVYEVQPPFYKNKMQFYSLGFLLLRTYAYYFMQSDIQEGIMASTSLSSLIVENLGIICWFLVDNIKKIYLLTHTKLINQIFNILRRLINGSTAEAETTGKGRLYKLADFAIAFGFVNLILDCVLQISLRSLVKAHSFWTHAACTIVNETSEFVFTLLEIGLIVLIGGKLIEIYRKLAIHNLLDGDCPADETYRNFKDLKECFTLYNSLTGFLILVSIGQNCFAIFYRIYFFIGAPLPAWSTWPAGLYVMLACLNHFIIMYAFVYFGDYSQSVMKNTKDTIQDTLTESKMNLKWVTTSAVQDRTAIAKYILKFKWKLNVCGLYDVDYKFLLMVTILHFIIMFSSY